MVEERSFFVEKTAGRYLNRRNATREPWGRSWERQRRSHAAVKQMDEEATRSSRMRRQAELVGSFAELLSLIPDDEGVQISPDKFIDLYQALPAALRRRLIHQGELVDLYWTGDWQRTSVWRKDGGGLAYLVDARNRVMRHLNISRALLDAAEIYGKVTPGRLTDIPAFAGRIYPSDRFFAIVFRLSEEERTALFMDPDILLQLPRPVMQVGVASAEDPDGYATVGFESAAEGGFIVTTYPALPAPLNRVTWMLAWEDADTIFATMKSAAAEQPPSDTVQSEVER